ncbi:MAG: PmoA family protein [Planctomycetota bacterium]
MAPFPLAQVMPMPGNQASFQTAGREILRYHFGPELLRPYWFPLVGPFGFSLTRIGHPHDPVGHAHHRSIWIGHQFCNGVDFWTEKESSGRIIHDCIVQYDDGDSAKMTTRNYWVATGGTHGVRLAEDIREVQAMPLRNGEAVADFRLIFRPVEKEVAFGKTSFGFLALRVAKTMGVHDGGGEMTNSEGGKNEEGVFWKPARWMDYSGPIAGGVWNGIAFLDHPSNHDHPATWHVRDDGWMGAAPCFKGDIVLKGNEQLVLRYRLWAHEGAADLDKINEHWQRFAETK